jgi:hypothetical protein
VPVMSDISDIRKLSGTKKSRAAEKAGLLRFTKFYISEKPDIFGSPRISPTFLYFDLGKFGSIWPKMVV